MFASEGVDRIKMNPDYNTTYIYHNKQGLGSGDRTHFDGEALAHARVSEVAEYPNVGYILENQSDWAQSPFKDKLTVNKYKGLKKGKEKASKVLDKYYSKISEIKENKVSLPEWHVNARLDAAAKSKNTAITAIGDYNGRGTKKFLHKGMSDRNLQETVKLLVDRGNTTIRVPTNTALIDIQGYTPINQTIHTVKPGVDAGQAKHIEGALKKKSYYADLEAEKVGVYSKKFEDSYETSDNILRLLRDKITKETGDKHHYLIDYDYLMAESGILDKQAKYISKMKSSPIGQQRLLKKKHYDNFIKTHKNATEIFDLPIKTKPILKTNSKVPKQIKKLFGQEVDLRDFKDSKGVLWHEFDAPKEYLKGRGEIQAFSMGGLIEPPTKSQDTTRLDKISPEMLDFPVIQRPTLFNRDDFASGLMYVESSNGKQLFNKNTTASGPFQFMYSEMKKFPEYANMTRQEFGNMGMDKHRKILDKTIDGGFKGRPGLEKNARDLKKRFGKEAWFDYTPAEIALLTHNMGRGGAIKYFESRKAGKTFTPSAGNMMPEDYIKKYHYGVARNKKEAMLKSLETGEHDVNIKVGSKNTNKRVSEEELQTLIKQNLELMEKGYKATLKSKPVYKK